MTESELLASADFLKWCAHWEQDRHCPHAMADWALENVGELAFEACVWAHEKEKRGNAGRGEWGEFERTRPTKLTIWWSCEEPEYSRTNFPSNVPIVDELHQAESFPAAIAYYLTNFSRELAAKYPPKRELATV